MCFLCSTIIRYKNLSFFQTIVRGENKNVRGVTGPSVNNNLMNGIPKTSHVARSNSLRSSSPPRPRRHQPPNMPPVLPEGEILVMPPHYNPAAINHNQFPVSPFFILPIYHMLYSWIGYFKGKTIGFWQANELNLLIK